MSDLSNNVSVGVGGWAYLPGRNRNKLETCSKLYDFVEVNSSFYKLPDIELAKKWRASVPVKFQFSVRANGKLTHENHLEPTTENFDAFEENLVICRSLGAFVLHFQFPPSFEVTKEVIANWHQFFGSMQKEQGLYYAFEVRNPKTKTDPFLQSFIQDNDFIPCDDISRDDLKPSDDSKILYSRVFGLGDHTKWSFATPELEEMKEKIASISATRKFVTFHNMTMYEDGARMKELLKPARGDPSGATVGIASLEEVLLAEEIEFPISGQELASQIAWRTITSPDGRRIHPNEITSKIPGNPLLQVN